MDVPAYPLLWLVAGLCLIAAVSTAIVVRICRARRDGEGMDKVLEPALRVITVLNWPEQQAPPPYSALPVRRQDSDSSADSALTP